jgi:hypothetical protein
MADRRTGSEPPLLNQICAVRFWGVPDPSGRSGHRSALGTTVIVGEKPVRRGAPKFVNGSKLRATETPDVLPAQLGRPGLRWAGNLK